MTEISREEKKLLKKLKKHSKTKKGHGWAKLERILKRMRLVYLVNKWPSFFQVARNVITSVITKRLEITLVCSVAGILP